MLLNNLNSKLGKDIYCFNLPLSTCRVFATEICHHFCYARHGSYTFSKNQAAYERNYQISLQPDFEALIQLQIDAKHRPIEFIRLHSSGDFYSQAYFEKWNRIATQNPQIRILAYTRNYNLNYLQHAPNFLLYYSIDDSTAHVNKTIPLRTRLVSFSSDLKSGYTHMQRIEEYWLCLSKCSQCKICFRGDKNIAFLQRWQANVYSVQGGISKPSLGEFRDKTLAKQRASIEKEKIELNP